MIIQTQYVLARNSSYPIQGGSALSYTNQGITRDFYWPGSAATGNVTSVDASMLDYTKLIAADWQLEWDPNAHGAGQTGVRLVDFRVTESDVREWPEIMSDYTGPTTLSVAPGTILQYLQAALYFWGTVNNVGCQIGHRTHGNGSHGPLIYSSVISCYWQL